MAQIHEYVAETQVSGPIQTRQARTADTGDVGNAIANLGNTLSQAEKAIQQRSADAEVSHLSAQMAARHAAFTQQLDDTLNAPGAENDRELSKNFMDSYDEQMSDLVDNAKSHQAQQYLEKANAAMRGQFQTASMHGQTVLAGESAVSNMETSSDQLSASLINNPSGLDSVKELNELAIENLPIPERHKEELRAATEAKLTMASIQGWIKLDPKGTADRLSKGEWDEDLNGQQKLQLEHQAEVGIEAKRIQADREEKRRQDVASRLQETESGRLLSKLYSQEGLDTKDVLGNPKLDEATQEHFLHMIESNKGDKLRDNPQTVRDLFDRIHGLDGQPPITDETQLYKYFGNGITGPTLDWMRKEVIGKKSQAGIDEAELKTNYINRVVRPDLMGKENVMAGIPDPEGAKHFASWLSDFQEAYENGKQSGLKPQEMLDPKNQHFLGNVIDPQLYKRSPQEIMQSMFPQNPAFGPPPTAAGSPGGGTPESRRPGEKPADYLERIKKKK